MQAIPELCGVGQNATRIDCTVAGASLKDVYLYTVGHNDFL
jgi:hypothetical protein